MKPIEYLKKKQTCQYYIGIKLNEFNYSFDELITEVYNEMTNEYFAITVEDVRDLIITTTGENLNEYYWDNFDCSIRYKIPNKVASNLLYEYPKFMQLITDGSVNYTQGEKVSTIYLNFVLPEDDKIIKDKGVLSEFRDNRFNFDINNKNLTWHVSSTNYRLGVFKDHLFSLMTDPSYNTTIVKGTMVEFRESQINLLYYNKANLSTQEINTLENNENIEIEESPILIN